MEKPDAHAHIEKLKDTLETAIRFQDAPAASVERTLKIVNAYYTQLQQWQEQDAKRKREQKEWEKKEQARVSEPNKE